MKIVENQDLVTLITCTPYMVNTHRLLVTGHRIPYEESTVEEAVTTIEKIKDTSKEIIKKPDNLWIWISGCLTIFIGVLLMLFRLLKHKRSGK